MNAPSSAPRFSVVVPTCRRDDALALCLTRLAPGTQTLPAGDYEVIVTDDGAEANATTSPTAALLARAFPWTRWIAGPRRGPAANRNHGATAARGEWVVFTDDDCLPTAGWLAAYADTIAAAPAAEVVEGRTLANGERTAIDEEAPINTDGGFLWSCNFAMRRARFQAMGGFDEGFPGPAMEDVELCTRLRKERVPLRFAPEAVVRHPWRPRKGRTFLRLYARSTEYYLAKHPDRACQFALPLLWRVLLVHTPRQLWAGLTRHGGRGVGRLAGLELYAFGLLAWRALRR
jgi:GT2 family glycosyltransferase